MISKIELYIDSALPYRIESALEHITGITTNPQIFTKEYQGDENKIKYYQILKKIVNYGKPVHIQPGNKISEDKQAFIDAARKVAQFGNNVIVKVPVNVYGIDVLRQLHSEGIRTNATACLSVNQAYAAAKYGGAEYVAFYWRQMGLANINQEKELGECISKFQENGIKTKVMAAGFNDSNQIEAALTLQLGAVTIVPDKISKYLNDKRLRNNFQDLSRVFSDLPDLPKDIDIRAHHEVTEKKIEDFKVACRHIEEFFV